VWLGDPSLALYSVGVASAWQAYGFYMVIFLASIQGIDPQLHEAARVDGANAWQRTIDITIPSLHNTMTLVLTLAFISAMKGFGTVWAMTQGGPGYASELVAVYIWRSAFQTGDIGRATAAGISLAAIVIILSALFNRWRDRDVS
jgi:raffinose/stachyose/melibiose transport system permease protein